jgi:hypothetical protein
MKILLGDFSAKVGREYIFKPTIGNESLRKMCNDNRIRVITFATYNNLVVKSSMFLIEAFIYTPEPLLMDRYTTRLITF